MSLSAPASASAAAAVTVAGPRCSSNAFIAAVGDMVMLRPTKYCSFASRPTGVDGISDVTALEVRRLQIAGLRCEICSGVVDIRCYACFGVALLFVVAVEGESVKLAE